MFKKSILALSLVALTAPLAGTAFAGQGADQLAAQLGVPVGTYSVAQMIQLQEARRDGDKAAEALILNQGPNSVSRSSMSGDAATSAGAAQLARLVGVAPGAYSVNEMIRLQDAISENDVGAIAFILGGSNGGNTGNDIGVVTTAKTQLAASLGLDPAAHTTADLVARYLDSIS